MTGICPVIHLNSSLFTFLFSLPKQEDDDFERHIEENDFGIGILRNHALAVFDSRERIHDAEKLGKKAHRWSGWNFAEPSSRKLNSVKYLSL